MMMLTMWSEIARETGTPAEQAAHLVPDLTHRAQ
jgi:hypothetical protein